MNEDSALVQQQDQAVAKKPRAVSLATWPMFATHLAAAVASLRFKVTQADAVMVKDAQALDVKDAETSTAAGEALVKIKRLRREAEAHYEHLKRPFNGLLSVVREFERSDVGIFAMAEQATESKIVRWRREEEARERERVAREQEENDRRAREERDREVAAMQRVAAMTAQPALREQIQAEAVELERAPLVVESVAVETVKTSVPGLSAVKRYKGEIRGDAALMKFLKGITARRQTIAVSGALGIVAVKGQDKVYRSTWIDDQVRSNRGEVNLPGVTIVEDEGLVGR